MNGYVNIKLVILKLLSKWHYFVIAIAFFLPVAYIYLQYADKVYYIQSSLLLKSEKRSELSREQFLKGMDLFAFHTALEDEIGMLNSFGMVGRAVSELDFGISYYVKKTFRTGEKYQEFPFVIELDSSFSQVIDVPVNVERIGSGSYRIKCTGKDVEVYNYLTNAVEEKVDKIHIDSIAHEGIRFQTTHLAFTLRSNNSYKASGNEKYYFVIHNLNAVIEDFQNSLKISPISRESNIVHLGMRSKVPNKAKVFVNKLLEVYLANELYKKNQLGLKTIQFIDRQLSDVSDSLKRVEGWLEDFRVKSNIQDINVTSETLSKNLNRLEDEKAAVEVKIKYYTYISTSIAEGRLGDIVAPSTFGLDDPLLSSLLIELSKLNQERAGLNYNAKEENPLAEVVDLKIRNTKKTLLENVNNIINVSHIALNDLDDRMVRIRKQLNGLPHNERELVNIQRQFDFSDNVYNYLLEKRAEAGIAIASNSVEKTIVDRARVIGERPVSPDKRVVYLIACILSFLTPIGFIVLRDFWNEHIRSNEDLEKATSIPVIGNVIHGNKQERSSLVIHRRSALAESFHSIRVNLQYLTLGRERNVIGFTSSVENEGKTFCAVNLAAAIAQSGKKTILIDADMRRPSVSPYFKMDNTNGLSNYLVGACQLSEIIHPTQIKGFHVITSGPVPPNPLNLIGLQQVEQLIARLKDSYDTVIIDAPPIGYVAEYVILMKYTDATIYVVRSEYTNRNHLSRINRLYSDHKISNVSVLLNDVKLSRNGYAYSYYGTEN